MRYVVIAGELDIAFAPDFDRANLAASTDGRELRVVLGGVTFCDSFGLRGRERRTMNRGASAA